MIYILTGIVLACAVLSVVELLVWIWDRLEAAICAGNTEKSAAVTASRMLKNANTLAYIAKQEKLKG